MMVYILRSNMNYIIETGDSCCEFCDRIVECVERESGENILCFGLAADQYFVEVKDDYS